MDTVEGELKTMLDQATDRMRAAETSYDDYRRTAQVELVKKEVDTLLLQRAELMKVSVDLEAERAKLARAEKELGAREPITNLRQTIVENPAAAEIAPDKARPRAICWGFR